MQFTDFTFLIGFFPLCWIIYQFLPEKFKNIYLLLASLIFYALGSVENLLVLFFILAWNYLNSRQIQSSENDRIRKNLLIETIGVNILVLFFYKYLFVWMQSLSDLLSLGWIVQMPSIPLGLSFYIFSSLSAVIQIYWGKEKLCSFIDFGLFTAFFAWVNMGPIEHYPVMKSQLKHHPISKGSLNHGAALFLQGLAYKVILADNLALLFSQFEQSSTVLAAWLMSLCYFFELYFDFCGYSRMARGMASCFGFIVPPNFSNPYQALSIQDYWRRWHISLTNWFRTYVYIPLGGNRVDQAKWIRNILIVWALTGLWHGAALSFLFWGLYQALFILLERLVYPKAMEKGSRIFRHSYVILIALLGDVFFYAGSLSNAFGIYGRLIGIGAGGLFDDQSLFALSQGIILLVICIFILSGLSTKCASLIEKNSPISYSLVSLAGYASLLIACFAFLTSQTAQTFLYAVF